MEINKKISFNLSPTSINTFHQSPLLFYLRYISKVPDDTPVPVCYGLSGNIVHDCLERYAKREFDRDGTFSYFAQQWLRQNLHKHRDINNSLLNQNEYLLALIKGIEIVDLHSSHVCEETISLPFAENSEIQIGIKGIIDLQAIHNPTSEQVIIDYKTSNSMNSGKDFERQALFYNYLLHKKGKSLPHKTIFHYLKLGAKKTYSFSTEDVGAFEEELNAITEQIFEYGSNIGNYPIGNVDDLFNTKKKACIREIIRRNGYSNSKEFVDTMF
ncbi:MAG: PD-(D/E)XK nuclease family protein [Nanoarchaeota archaeon]|nr:PD-(D/E)XK nuclease family protein [Nanoarchaeota archaeon]